jgi:hypothetical protein
MASSAARMARCRQRKADGTVLVRISVPAAVVSDLSDLGWLAPRAGVAQALVDLLEAAIECRVQPDRDVSRSSESFPGVGR